MTEIQPRLQNSTLALAIDSLSNSSFRWVNMLSRNALSAVKYASPSRLPASVFLRKRNGLLHCMCTIGWRNKSAQLKRALIKRRRQISHAKEHPQTQSSRELMGVSGFQTMWKQCVADTSTTVLAAGTKIGLNSTDLSCTRHSSSTTPCPEQKTPRDSAALYTADDLQTHNCIFAKQNCEY